MERCEQSRVVLSVEGMTCTGCETRIENALRRMDGLIDVSASYARSSVDVTWDAGRTGLEDIIKTIEKADYSVKYGNERQNIKSSIDPGETAAEESNGAEPEKSVKATACTEEADKPGDQKKKKALQIVGTGVIIAALYLIISQTQGFSFVPEVNQSMGYGILFLVGLLTSLHCVAMCGGINLSVCMQYKAGNDGARFGKFIPTALYNLGRVISYTVVGGIVGALGSAISLPGRAKGAVAAISGIFMLVMGLNMLDVFPALRKLNPRLPKFLGRSVYDNSNTKGPLIVGMLNGLMPCGPLQAMQLYALGTGSFAAGALSMFLFSMGTVPLMFGFGALSSVLKGKFTHKMMKAGSVLVIVLGLVMLNRGLNLSGFGVTMASAATGAGNIATIENGVQTVSIDLESGRYSPIIVQKGIPVKWTIRVDKGDLNGCNNPVTIPQLAIQKRLVTGDNVIEFTPEKEGDMIYTCWMGMISSRIRVVSDLGSISEEDKASLDSPGLRGIGGFAEVPTDEVAVAEIRDGIQYVEIDVNDDEYSPAVVVLQENVQTVWKINGKQLNDHNGQVVFPAFMALIDVAEGENEIGFVPEFDFDFQCPQGLMAGYVKVVEDINSIDIPAIQSELKGYRPAPISAGASCH
jgi:sulfite exporter TauE/SafE/copper chaperone CopZ